MPWPRPRSATAKIGTTLKGIGPAYADKARRVGLRAGDLLEPVAFAAKFAALAELESRSSSSRSAASRSTSTPSRLGTPARSSPQLAPYVTNTVDLLHEAVEAGRAPAARRGAGDVPRSRPRHLSVRHVVEPDGRRGLHRHGARTAR